MKVPALAPEQKVAVGGAVLAIVAGALPWITTEGGSVVGIYAEGFLTTMAALSVLGIVTLWQWRGLQMIGVALFGTMIFALTVQFIFSMDQIAGPAMDAVNAGVGAYLTVAAGALIGGSGVYGLVERRRALAEAEAAGEPGEETTRSE